MLTLCTLGPVCHAWLLFPSSSCSMLPPSLLTVDCLSRSLSGGPGPPSPPSPVLTPFPSGQRQQHPALLSGTIIVHPNAENCFRLYFLTLLFISLSFFHILLTLFPGGEEHFEINRLLQRWAKPGCENWTAFQKGENWREGAKVNTQLYYL